MTSQRLFHRNWPLGRRPLCLLTTKSTLRIRNSTHSLRDNQAAATAATAIHGNRKLHIAILCNTSINNHKLFPTLPTITASTDSEVLKFSGKLE